MAGRQEDVKRTGSLWKTTDSGSVVFRFFMPLSCQYSLTCKLSHNMPSLSMPYSTIIQREHSGDVSFCVRTQRGRYATKRGRFLLSYALCKTEEPSPFVFPFALQDTWVFASIWTSSSHRIRPVSRIHYDQDIMGTFLLCLAGKRFLIPQPTHSRQGKYENFPIVIYFLIWYIMYNVQPPFSKGGVYATMFYPFRRGWCAC